MIFWATFFSLLSAKADMMLRVRPHVVVAPKSEVALIQLIDAENLSPQTEFKLKHTYISRAPEFGERQEISDSSLSSVLRDIVKAERAKGERVHLVLPKAVTIDTVQRDLSSEKVMSELLQAWQPLCGDCKLTIEGLSLPRVEKVRDWSLKLKAELPRGSFSVPVELIRDNNALLPAWISGRLIAQRRVPVAKRLLNTGERVQATDFAWEYRDTTFSLDGIPSSEDLIGRKLRQMVRASDVIWSSHVEREKAIHRGDVVQVKSGSGDWEVSLRVIAQQDAFVGDTISLKNPKTNGSLMGQVVGQGEVELR